MICHNRLVSFKPHRLPNGCSICLSFPENPSECPNTRGPISPILDCISCFGNCKKKGRFKGCRILVWSADSQHFCCTVCPSKARGLLNVLIQCLIRLPAIRVPAEKPRSIRHKATDLKPLIQGIADPFLYNPRKAAAGKVIFHRHCYLVSHVLSFFRARHS